MVLPIIVSALGTMPKRPGKDIEGTGDLRKNQGH